ncbi:MAG: DUF45 domain-containing protein, partial [Alphaproteobacteria bacterium]|nr:DUF45 domain-containing protein [Alphaproteobacteria bacterium]
MPRLFSVLKEESLAPLLPPIAHRRADGTAPTWRLKHNSRARRMILRYHKGVATITLPRFATSSDVKKFLANSTDWLEKQISNEQLFHQQHALRHQQTISVMGRNLMLIFTSGRGRVAEKNNQLIVPCHQQKHQQKLKRYLWRRAEQEFPALLARQCAMLSLP